MYTIQKNELSAGPSPLWDSVSTDGSLGKSKSEEMISREDSPKWNNLDRQRGCDASVDFGERVRLPSWDCLEATLDQKLSKCEPDSLEVNRDVGIDYLLAANASKEFSEQNHTNHRPHKHSQRKTPVLKQTKDMALKLTMPKEAPTKLTKKGETSGRKHSKKISR